MERHDIEMLEDEIEKIKTFNFLGISIIYTHKNFSLTTLIGL